MKTLSTISSLLLIGAIGFLASSILSTDLIEVDLSDEDIHLYL